MIFFVKQDDLLFWVDIDLHHLERSTIHGKERQILVRDDFSYPIRGKLVLLAVYGDYVYWACRDSHIISRVNKFNGADKSLVKSKVFHLSSLISVTSLEHKTNPCAGEGSLKYFNLVNIRNNSDYYYLFTFQIFRQPMLTFMPG